MPHDQFHDDDDDKELAPGAQTFKEWECPGCNAHNFSDPPMGQGDEVLCNYCGVEYRVKVSDEGKLKLREN